MTTKNVILKLVTTQLVTYCINMYKLYTMQNTLWVYNETLIKYNSLLQIK